ncbi:glycosyltransferase family 1 protein [Pseudohoeflea suaedae]|uniref:Glycosyltransferase family 1 protein n=1 Tax=Pseudohoeflea suaedae TaxID=877384 RepID=A0A4R5PI70_9HYPH|nr:glycosyltransferase family 4 protein [Pseudohoeflea suaedae]TDH34926.1 glycosyltransferase family 1 protein [Pseudohoeflea suaedae]
MSRSVIFAFPGHLDTKTGGYGYDRRVIEGLQGLGWDVALLALGEGFPFPSDETLRQAEASLSKLPDGAKVIIDGLAFGVLDRWAERESRRLRIVALVHHPLALETGNPAVVRQSFHDREKRALAHADHVIVTSQTTADTLTADYAVDADKIDVAVPGTDRASRSEPQNSVPLILSIGTLTRRKGHDVLVAALKRIESLSWQAVIVGSPAHDRQTAQSLETQISELGLSQRIRLAGEQAELDDFLQSADIFALASRYEGYGMVFAEALAHGLPIVACRAGAIPEVVPEEAGILVPVDDAEALAAALGSLLADEALRTTYADGAYEAGSRLPGWDVTAGIFNDRLRTLP